MISTQRQQLNGENRVWDIFNELFICNIISEKNVTVEQILQIMFYVCVKSVIAENFWKIKSFYYAFERELRSRSQAADQIEETLSHHENYLLVKRAFSIIFTACKKRRFLDEHSKV